ncbi:hypothetical protein NZK33_11425 [Cyanobium sp. FGCU-6]|nr:hypothetical protein [Cyanobium sp. FGCU6]
MAATPTTPHWCSTAAAPRRPETHQLALLPEPAQPWCCWDLVCPDEAWAAEEEPPLRWST